MVYRVYVEKKPELAHEAASLFSELTNLLGVKDLTGLRVINRYDVENLDPELFDYAKKTVFSEPQVDLVYDELPQEGSVFAVEYLPGQFDQRADSAAQCIQILSRGERPAVRTAKVYVLSGELTDAELETVKHYVINPVEAREASLEKPETLAVTYDMPETVESLPQLMDMDNEALAIFIDERGLAMDVDDLRFTRDYFHYEGRIPTITEI